MPAKPATFRITLGVKSDGHVEPPAQVQFGHVTTGPLGLLALLENQLGIPAEDTAFTTRLVQYLACLDEIDHETAFYHESYSADPFSVARTLLQWRDQWYTAGWRGAFAAPVSQRLADMGRVEALARQRVAPGTGQRLQRVQALLSQAPPLIDEITLLDPLEAFPWQWQTVLKALEAPLKQPPPESAPVVADSDSDLARLQRALLEGESGMATEYTDDGSVLLLSAPTPQDSAPIAALLLRHWLAPAASERSAVLSEVRGSMLDEAMEDNHCPRPGFMELSIWRPVFQVLPLACELLWEPLDAGALFQFLSHPIGPLPRRVRRELAAVVADIPGTGSEAWRETLKQCLDDTPVERRAALADEIANWLEQPRFAPREGAPCAAVAARAAMVADWLYRMRPGETDTDLQELYTIALNQARELGNAVERLHGHGRDTLTRDNVLRLIEDVRGRGAPLVDRGAETCPGLGRVQRLEHTGAAHTEVDNLLWWDSQASDALPRLPWSRQELHQLESNGVYLHNEQSRLDWLARAWLRPVFRARRRLVMMSHDDAEIHHPTWDRITALLPGITVRSLSDCDLDAVLGLPGAAIDARPLPAPRRWWQLPAGSFAPSREVESYSSLEAYVFSPYQWLLRYAARLHPGSLVEPADDNRLKGRLLHRVLQEFFETRPGIQTLTDEGAENWLAEFLPVLLEQEGAVLLAAGRQAERQAFHSNVLQALQALLGHLQVAGVVSVAMELTQQGRFSGGALTGAIDLLAVRADGAEAVVDIKWGGGNYRRDLLRGGSDLQLAIYGHLREGESGIAPSLSYFIARNCVMLNLGHDFFPRGERIEPETGENRAQFWRRFEQTWQWRHEQLTRGLVEVTVSGTEPGTGSVPGPAGLALPDTSDHFNDFAALTGWAPEA